MYQLEDYDFPLPEHLIAQRPLLQRDTARLLHLNRETGRISHGAFGDVGALLKAGDVLVLNNTKVIPGRLLGHKPTGGKVEVLILDYAQGAAEGEFTCLLKASKRPKPGSLLHFQNGFDARVLSTHEQMARIRFNRPESLEQLLDTHGHIPLPPYIRRPDSSDDRHDYQTVYAAEKGAIAAPTAGLHFTRDLIDLLEGQGVQVAYVTLHVGYGTFLPVRVDDIREHRMHAEAFTISSQTARMVNDAKSEGRRIVAVGTTSVRTLEFAVDDRGQLAVGGGWCDLFIYPGYTFKMVDAMITNFHLPKSTLMMLVSAFAGHDHIMNAYAEAVRQEYRFFSYGDAMFIA